MYYFYKDSATIPIYIHETMAYCTPKILSCLVYKNIDRIAPCPEI